MRTFLQLRESIIMPYPVAAARQHLPQPGDLGNTLLDDLIAFYKLEDVSDSGTHSLTLTNNNTVTFVGGKVGNAANFAAASTQYLSRAHSDVLSPTGDMTLSTWVNFTTLGANRPVVMKMGDLVTGTTVEYGIYYSSSANRIRAAFRHNAGLNVVNADALGAPSTGTWYHVVIKMESNVPSIRVNAGTANTGGVIVRSTTTQDLVFGRVLISGTPTYLDGLIDATGLWNRAISDTEVASLFNDGNGREHPFS